MRRLVTAHEPRRSQGYSAAGRAMIVNARMYSVTPEAADRWRRLLSAIVAAAGVRAGVVEHAPPAPLADLWHRDDLGAVFMCGLPYSQAAPQAVALAAPVPSPAEFSDEPVYWSDFVAHTDSGIRQVEDAFGGRIAFTVPDSQSGCMAALSDLAGRRPNPDRPLFREVVAPTITPLGALSAVVSGAAEIAPIDSYAFRLLQRFEPALTAAVRVVGQTARTPIPLLVATPPGSDALRSAFLQAHREPASACLMGELLLQRFTQPDPASYDILRERAAAAGRQWMAHRFAAVVHPAFQALLG